MTQKRCSGSEQTGIRPEGQPRPLNGPVYAEDHAGDVLFQLRGGFVFEVLRGLLRDLEVG